jgi:mannose-6-phosphate isomerase-like protein (cupin superfamily)
MTDTIIRHEDVEPEKFPGGATYRTLVGDDHGSTPVRCGIQTSPPGYATPNHAHPYVEIVTVLEGTGEAWTDGEDGITEIGPGTTMVFPPNTAHGFRVTGETPLVTYGVHSSPDRIIEIKD